MNDETPDASTIQSWCVKFVSKILNRDPDRIDPNVEIDRIGLDSATAVALILTLEEQLGIELSPELFFDYPTIAGISEHLASRVSELQSEKVL